MATVPVNPKPFLNDLTGKLAGIRAGSITGTPSLFEPQVLTKLKWGMEYKGTLKCALCTDSCGCFASVRCLSALRLPQPSREGPAGGGPGSQVPGGGSGSGAKWSVVRQGFGQQLSPRIVIETSEAACELFACC